MSERSLVARARTLFLRWLDEAGTRGRGFLQIRIRRAGDGLYEVRHAGDVGEPLGGLTRYRDPQAALELARTTAAGRHRPLRTSPDLRRGWVLVELDGAGLWTAVSRLYPGAAVHWYLHRAGELEPTPWAATAARQTGLYARVAELDGGALDAAVRACCGGGMCLRTVAWSARPGMVPPRPPGQDDGAASGTVVPCREACTLFVSFAREALAIEGQLPSVVSYAPSGAERRRLADTCRAAAERTALGDAAVDAADFTNGKNPRRLRYWADRLESGT